MEFKTYNGDRLYNCHVSYKIDGVRAHLVNGGIVSRKGKPLYNIPPIYNICEVYIGDWNTTVSAVRTKTFVDIPESCLYCLDPIDKRLIVGFWKELSSDIIIQLMKQALELGFEGLVIKCDDIRYKVKPIETYDKVVIGTTPGKGRNKGRIGALLTDCGKVGTGLTDEIREMDMIGKIIEVSAMSLTKTGKFRHARLIRIRYDKEN